MKVEFRKLRADEIDCRINTVGEKGCSLLLYKDARCDMNILDETVGAMNWQRYHSRDNANCTVSIYDSDKKEWVGKEDTGTESYTEKEKGLASDSFKRACTNWGIGRELYTAPFIWIPSGLCNIIPKSGGKYTCNDRFAVKSIEYNEKGAITHVVITDLKGNTVFETGKKIQAPSQRKAGQDLIKKIESEMQRTQTDPRRVCATYRKRKIDELTEADAKDALQKLEKLPTIPDEIPDEGLPFK